MEVFKAKEISNETADFPVLSWIPLFGEVERMYYDLCSDHVANFWAQISFPEKLCRCVLILITLALRTRKKYSFRKCFLQNAGVFWKTRQPQPLGYSIPLRKVFFYS